MHTVSYQALEDELNDISRQIKMREDALVENAGVNTNSTIAGLHNGAFEVATPDERQRIHDIKQDMMSRTGEQMEAARARNIARRSARKLARAQQAA
jgi:hypothetical protein